MSKAQFIQNFILAYVRGEEKLYTHKPDMLVDLATAHWDAIQKGR